MDAIKEMAQDIVTNSNELKDEFQNQINRLLGKLSMMEIDLDAIKENAKLTVHLNKDEMLDVAKAIKLQKDEVVLLDNMLDKTKNNFSHIFTSVFEVRLKDISKKIEAMDSQMDLFKKRVVK